jgi:hypothetical protein
MKWPCSIIKIAHARMASIKNNLLLLAVIWRTLTLYTCLAGGLDAFRAKNMQNTRISASIGVF